MSKHRQLLNKFHTFRSFSISEKLWIIPVFLLLGLSRLLIIVLPFRAIAPLLGRSTGPAPWLPLLSEQELNKAREVRLVVNAVAQYTPWTSNCFPMAITASTLLRLHNTPYVLFFGVNNVQGELKAHAWVASSHLPVTGGRSFREFTVMNCYSNIDVGR